jgi:hypothetical protein
MSRSVEEILAFAKEGRRNMIRHCYEQIDNVPIEVNGVFFNGGYDSVLKLDAARRLVLESINLGLAPPETTVTFFDANNVGHAYSVEDALVIVLTLGNLVQGYFSNKQAKMTAIDEATTVAEVEAVVW